MTGIEQLTAELDEHLARADADLVARYPGDRGVRQPIHTVYVPADQYSDRLIPDWGASAQQTLAEHGGSVPELAQVLGLRPSVVSEIYDRVRAKLASEPIEDLRIDFEDGYGDRSDDEEDRAVVAAAHTLAATVRAGEAPPYYGIRFKSFEAPTRRRGLRTLDLFVAELSRNGGVSDGLVVTLPKVTSLDQVEAMVMACDRLEQAHGLATGQLAFEIQVETPQSVLAADGRVLIAPMIHAANGRCTGLHYGTYDYSASCGIAAEYQSMEHPAADQAKALMQVAAAGTGVFVSDGSTNVLPVGSREAVHSAWRLHARLIRRSLERGFYQGWDLHPAQLPSRFAATYAFYREGLPSASARLRAYTGGGDSGYLDEPATAVALATFVLRGVECGAVDEDEVHRLIGIDLARLRQLARRPAALAEPSGNHS
ncbi:MAG: aldolase/citrate lyase family protein [Actinomycetota bacterium]|nr:aldolase/citrate lyase family protein [Actinomycetota bacterium]